jgi:hydroxyacylglutathione hydrolase
MVHVEQFFIEGLGHQSYFVTDSVSGVGAVIDPRRDVEIYLEAAERAGVHVTHVFETHVHNDYITGARELAERVGATIVSAADAGLLYEHLGVRDGDRVTVGTLTFQVLSTPGHTPFHISFAVYEPEHDTPYAVFSGGSMLVANAGRTDLVSPGLTLSLTRDQYRSLRRLLDALPEDVLVYPTHGAGSFCGASTGAAPARYTTIGQERLASPAAHVRDEAEFVKQQLAGYGLYPRYYVYMHDINQHGPRVLGGLPELSPLAPEAVRLQMRDGVALIDGRSRGSFAREHVPGSYNIELDATFSTYVGWILPFNARLMLVMDDAAGRRDAVAQLIRIGYEQNLGYLQGGVPAWKDAGYPVGSFERIDVEELARRWVRRDPMVILDVRDDAEWSAGHIPGSLHIHVGDLMRHLNQIPADLPVATVCRTGHRAEMAASIVAALGRQVIAVQEGGVPDWIAKGLPSVTGATEAPAVRVGEHVHL